MPLAAWGLKDISLFFDDPARLWYIILAALMQTAVVAVMPEAGHGGPGREGTKAGKFDLVLIQIIGLAIILSGAYSDRRGSAALGAPEAVRYLGLALFIGGMALMQWAEAALGRQFSIKVELQNGHRLVTSGPYTVIRHPRYAGNLIFFTGYCLTFRSWAALVLVALMAGVLLWRIWAEEEIMRQEFGDEWVAYAKRTWRLVPGLF